MKGQLSAEMLILIAVILAVVAIVAMQVLGSAQDTRDNVGSQTDSLNQMTEDAVKSPKGGYCLNGDDKYCQEGLSCNPDTNKCE